MRMEEGADRLTAFPSSGDRRRGKPEGRTTKDVGVAARGANLIARPRHGRHQETVAFRLSNESGFKVERKDEDRPQNPKRHHPARSGRTSPGCTYSTRKSSGWLMASTINQV